MQNSWWRTLNTLRTSGNWYRNKHGADKTCLFNTQTVSGTTKRAEKHFNISF